MYMVSWYYSNLTETFVLPKYTYCINFVSLLRPRFYTIANNSTILLYCVQYHQQSYYWYYDNLFFTFNWVSKLPTNNLSINGVPLGSTNSTEHPSIAELHTAFIGTRPTSQSHFSINLTVSCTCMLVRWKNKLQHHSITVNYWQLL